MIRPSECEQCLPTVQIETHGMGREVHTWAHEPDCRNNPARSNP